MEREDNSRLFRPWMENTSEQPRSSIPNITPAISGSSIYCPRIISEFSTSTEVPVARIEPMRLSSEDSQMFLDGAGSSPKGKEHDHMCVPETNFSRSHTPRTSFSGRSYCRSISQDHDHVLLSQSPSSVTSTSATPPLTDTMGFIESPVKPNPERSPIEPPQAMIESSSDFYGGLSEKTVISGHYLPSSVLAGHSSAPVPNLIPPLPPMPDLLTWNTLRVLMEEEHRKCSTRRRREKKFACPKCSMTFSNKGQLTGHYRKHTGERPYKCQSCSKRFTRNEELTRHTRIHTGDRPFACGLCSKRFGRKDHLNKHQRTHTAQLIAESSNHQQQLQVMLLRGSSAGVTYPHQLWSTMLPSVRSCSPLTHANSEIHTTTTTTTKTQATISQMAV